MARFTIIIGAILVVLGLGGYFGTGRASVTALIPAFAGGPILLAGVLALRDDLRKHAMHAAAALALLGFLAAAGRGVPKYFTAGEDGPSTAVYVQLLMAAVCLALVIACGRSFINARRRSAL